MNVLRTATISSTLRVFETRRGVEAIRTQPRLALKKEHSRVTLQVNASSSKPRDTMKIPGGGGWK